MRPITGRTHQIRVHAAHIGCAVLGDKLYGLPDDDFIRWLGQGDDYLLELKFPGIRDRLSERTAVAIDGEIFQDPLLQSIDEHSEVYFLPAIEGG